MDLTDPRQPCAPAVPPGPFPPPTGPPPADPSVPVLLETPVDFFILGPRRGPANLALWAVNARLLQWVTATHAVEGRWLSRAVRELYVDRSPAAGFAAPTLLPGTIVAFCRIRTARITINGLSFD